MLSKSRLARLLTPRFGVAWLFVGMLFLISAAGWWKFHRDLYVEEQAAVEALKRSGAKIAVHRIDHQFFGSSEEEADTSVPWNAPLLETIQMIFVEGDPDAEARDAALRLPRLKAYGEHFWPRPNLTAGPDGRWTGIENFLGRPLPELPEATLSIDDLEEPLAEGEEVDALEAERIAGAIRTAWQNPAAIPAKRLVVREKQIVGPSQFVADRDWLRVDLLEPGRGLRHSRGGPPQTSEVEESAALLLGDTVCWFDLCGERWRRLSRRIDDDDPHEMRLFRRHPDDEYPYLAPDSQGEGTVGNWMHKSDEPYKFDRIARVDDLRYRVDFSPFEIPSAPFDNSPVMVQVTGWQCVLRSDFGWAPEASRIAQTRVWGGGQVKRDERQMVQRFRPVGAYVTLAERIARDKVGYAGAAPVENEVSHCRYVTELDPEFDARVFDPLALDPEPWPKRRELPWLPWYRVTFLIGCGLAVALVGRRFIPKRAKEDVADEPRETDAEVTTTT